MAHHITFQVHVASFSWILMAPVATSQFLQPIQFPHSIAWLPSVHEMRAVMNFERSSTTTVSSHCTRASRTSDRPWENKWSPVCVGVVCVGSGGGGDVMLREEIQLVASFKVVISTTMSHYYYTRNIMHSWLYYLHHVQYTSLCVCKIQLIVLLLANTNTKCTQYSKISKTTHLQRCVCPRRPRKRL